MATDGDDERQWRAKLTETATTLMDRKLILDALDKCIRAKQERHTDLASAVALVGTCPDMCPEQERYFRIETNCVSPFENDEHGRPDEMRMVKEYRRSGADQKEPLPHELRPINVLQRSMTYLCLEIVDADYLPNGANLGEWFDFIWSRTRSIRKDITQQHLINLDSVNLIEKCARFHIYCAYFLCEEELKNFDPKINDENLRNCLQTLKEFYFELSTRSIYCPNEAEFRSYDVVLNLRNSETLSEMKYYRKNILHSNNVRFAVKIYQAFQSRNPIKFFQLARKANFFMSCILNVYFNQFRIDILNVVRRAYTVPKVASLVAFPVDKIMHLLAFDDLNDLAKFCDMVELEYDEVNGLVNIERNSAIIASTNSIKRSNHLVQVKLSTSPGRAILSDNSQLEVLPVYSSFDTNNRLVYDLSSTKATLEKPTLNDDSEADLEQFFADADDVNAWMLDFLRQINSNHVGMDEANAQSLMKRHNDYCGQLKDYYKVIETLKRQADHLGNKYRNRPEVVDHISGIEGMYKQLIEAANNRKQILHDAIALFRLMSEADGVDQWIQEKEKMLASMAMGRDMEDIEVMKHRFDTFEQEMNSNESRVKHVNDLANELQNVNHPNSQEIAERIYNLNDKWKKLKNHLNHRKGEINTAHEVQTFHIECRETISWVREKIRLLQTTEELANDQSGIITLQRRLNEIEQDLPAIGSQVNNLENEAQRIQDKHPEEAAEIRESVTQIRTVFDQLNELIKVCDAKLGEADDLHQFLRDLDPFQTWLKNTQTVVASKETPNSLAEAEKLLNRHQQIKKEIDSYTTEFNSIMEYGEKLTQDKTDHRHMFLRERLMALRDRWNELHKMWKNRQQLLSENLDLQVFLRDSKQVEVLLNQQEVYLAKDDVPSTLEQAESAIKRHEAFMEKMITSEDAVIALLQFADSLKNDGHFHSEKIEQKAEYIQEWYEYNLEMAKQYWSRLQDQYKLQQFLQNCDVLNEWIQEKCIIAQNETYQSAKTVHSKWTHHQAFEAEVLSNKDRLYQIKKKGEELVTDRPEMQPLIDEKLNELEHQLEQLERTTRERGQRLKLQVLASHDLKRLKRKQYLEEKYFRLWLQNLRFSRRSFIRAQFPAAPVKQRLSGSPVGSNLSTCSSTSASTSTTSPFHPQSNGGSACFTVIDPQIRTATASIRQSLLKKLNCDYETTVRLAKRKLAEREEQRFGSNGTAALPLVGDPFREVHTFHPDSAHLEPVKKRSFCRTSSAASSAAVSASLSTSPPAL